MENRRKIYFNPIFRRVNESRQRYVVLKGSAGSGKSVNIAQQLILKLSSQEFKGANLLCVRKIDESNRDSTFAELKTAIFRIFGDAWERHWSVRESPLRLTCLDTGNSVIFRGMKDDRQREKVKSITSDKGKLTWIWAEEATELTEEDFDILDDRLRGKLDNPNLYYQMIATFNPVSSTHWLKGKFFDTPDVNVLAHTSTFKDNLFVDVQYKMRMERRRERDPEGYRVYALGEWGLLGGQYFNNWSESLHVIKPFKIPDGWMRFRCMDWGSYHPYACYWIAVDYDGVMYVYRELYGYGGKANVGTKEPSTLVAQRIADSESADKRLIRYAVLDNACWGKQDTGAPSIAEEINRVLMDNGCMMFNPSVKGREQVGEEIRLRLQGWEDKEGKRHPGIKIFNTCFHLIRTLPEITHDKNQPEKYDTNGEDHCLIAGTLITTKRGDIPIEEVTTNDYVLTRQGYRRVLAAGLTRRSAKVITITCDNGKSLTGTGNHPIYIKGKDFIPLDAITYGDIMYSIGGELSCQRNKPIQQTASYLMESHSDVIQTLNECPTRDIIGQMADCESKESTICTGTFGSIITEKFQKAITSIIKMRTRWITELKILNYFPAKAIYNFMQKNIKIIPSLWRELKRTLTGKEIKPANGIVPKQDANGILNKENTRRRFKTENRELNVSAKCAEQNSKLSSLLEKEAISARTNAIQNTDATKALTTLKESARFAGKNIALTNIEEVKLVVESAVRSCREELEPADVYNLTVDEVHEYFANGFLVHNCIDAIGYGCMSRPWKPTTPKKQGKRDGWKFDYNNESNSRRSFMGV